METTTMTGQHTPNPTTLRALADRCERGEELDRELDAEIDAELFGGVAASRERDVVEGPGFGSRRRSPFLTASVDACLELLVRVVPGSSQPGDFLLQDASMKNGSPWYMAFAGTQEGFAPTPARALLAAILRAKAEACEAQG